MNLLLCMWVLGSVVNRCLGWIVWLLSVSLVILGLWLFLVVRLRLVRLVVWCCVLVMCFLSGRLGMVYFGCIGFCNGRFEV